MFSIAKNITTTDFLSPVLALNSSPEFINIKDPNGKTPLQVAIEAGNVQVVSKLLHTSGIELQFTGTNALQVACGIPQDTALILISEIFKINSTPEFINFKNSNGKTALENALNSGAASIVQALLAMPHIELLCSNGTALSKLIKKSQYYSDKLKATIDMIFELNSTPEFLNAFDNIALKTAIETNNIYVINKLINSAMVIPQNILTLIRADTANMVIDTILAKFSASQYINYVDPTTEKSLLMHLATNKDYLYSTRNPSTIYFIAKIIAHPQLKTAYRQPSTGKTALHFLGETMNKVLGGTQKNYSEYPLTFRFIKMLIDRNPALVDMKDNTGRGPGNPAYVDIHGPTRGYIKSRKLWFGTHKNTNQAGGKRAKSTRKKAQALI